MESESPPIGSPENPYAAPLESGTVTQRQAFHEIATPDLKRLRNDSHTLRAVVALLFLGICLMGIALVTSIVSGSGFGAAEFLVISVIGSIQLVAMIGLIQRGNWGRVLGFVSAIVMLIGFPIGTLIGILFMVSLVRGARLFGPNRLQHKALEAEWRYRKKHKVA